MVLDEKKVAIELLVAAEVGQISANDVGGLGDLLAFRIAVHRCAQRVD